MVRRAQLRGIRVSASHRLVMRNKCGLAPTLGNRSNDTEKMKEPIVKFTTTAVKTAIGAAGIAAVSVYAGGVASAAPPPNIQGFGTSEQLIDGPMVTSYTVSNLQPSSMAIPGYTPKGTLYQADIVARSDGGLV